MSEEVFFSFTLLVALGAVGYYFYLQKRKLDTLEKEVIFEEELRPKPRSDLPNPWRDYFRKYGRSRAYPMYDRVQRIVDLAQRGEQIHKEDMAFLKKIDRYINDYGQDHVVDESRRDEIEKYLQEREKLQAEQNRAKQTQEQRDAQMEKEMKKLMQLQQERKKAEPKPPPKVRDIDAQMDAEMKRLMQLQKDNEPPVIKGHTTEDEDPVQREIRQLQEERERRRQQRYKEREEAGPGAIESTYNYLYDTIYSEDKREMELIDKIMAGREDRIQGLKEEQKRTEEEQRKRREEEEYRRNNPGVLDRTYEYLRDSLYADEKRELEILEKLYGSKGKPGEHSTRVDRTDSIDKKEVK